MGVLTEVVWWVGVEGGRGQRIEDRGQRIEGFGGCGVLGGFGLVCCLGGGGSGVRFQVSGVRFQVSGVRFGHWALGIGHWGLSFKLTAHSPSPKAPTLIPDTSD